MTRSVRALETTPLYVHLPATVSRGDVTDGELRAGAAVVIDLGSAKPPIGVVAVVHWTQPIHYCTLVDAPAPHDAKTLSVRTSRAAPLGEVDVYGFASLGAYLQWLYPGIQISNVSEIGLAVLGSGTPPKTAGDDANHPPAVI